MPGDLKDSILSIFEASLDAQLRGGFAGFRGGAEAPAPPRRRAGLSKWTWRTTYSRRPVPPCTSPNSGPHPLHLPPRRRSREPGLFAHQKGRPRRSLPCAPARILLAYARRSMTLLAAWSEIVADWAPSFPQQRTFRRAVRQALGALGLRGPTLSVAHHLDPGPPAAQLEQRVLSPLALSLGTADLVCGRVAPCFALLSRPPGGRRRRRHPPAQDRPRHSPGALSPRSLSPPFHVNLMRGLRFLQLLCCSPASACPSQLSRSARAL